MYREIGILSAIVLLAIGVYLLYPHLTAQIAPPADLARVELAYRDFLDERGLTDPIPDVRLVLTKSNRMLYLLSGDELIERWSIALGREPVGAKSRARDGRTPTGEYSIIARDDDFPHHLFLIFNYPCRRDVDAGMREGLIDDRQAREFYRYETQGRLPPQDTPLGGSVGIHGGGTSRDWTYGSIAVDNDAVEILWGACPDGTDVMIYEDFLDWPLANLMPSYR